MKTRVYKEYKGWNIKGNDKIHGLYVV